MKKILLQNSRGWALALLTPLVFFTAISLRADEPKKAAVPVKAPVKVPTKAATPAKPPAATGAKPAAATPGSAAHPGAPGAHPAASAPGARPGTPAGGRGAAPAGFKSPGKVETGRNGAQFQRDSRGNVRDINRNGMAVHRGPAGSIRSERVRADGSRLVGDRRGGYVERRFSYGGRTLYRRNYYYGGRYYSRYYNPYSYHGVFLSVYAPSFYYGPAFYGYAYAPWGVPVAYSWGWGGSPWYGYYGGYFSPYPVYASPSLWLTDYLVAQSLQAAYQQQQAAAANAAAQQQPQGGYDAAPAPMTPEVKQQIADEVRRQIALENAERQNTAPNTMPDPASSGIARMMSDNTPHVFVAGAPLNLMTGSGECPITEGDVLQVTTPPAPNADSASAVVLASKGQDCAKGSTVLVALTDLQDMQNHMRETIDQGLGELKEKQGTGGLPALPASAAAPPTQAGFAAVAPPPDPTEQTDIAKQVQESSQAEQDALAGALGGPSDTPAPAASAPAPADTPTTTVSMGQTTAQVEAIMGKPKSIANGPGKVIYIYDGVKVIFVSGKVTDIQ